MTCCDEQTDNLSNREQAKALNKHCVEILPAEELTVDLVSGNTREENRETISEFPDIWTLGVIACGSFQIRELSDKPDFAPEDKQFSTVIGGLMTAADIITRASAQIEPYERVEVTVSYPPTDCDDS